MLQAAVVVMTVMGCGNEGTSCDFVTEPTQIWANKFECEAAIPEQLLEVQTANYPVITASCDERILATKSPEKNIVELEQPSNFEKIREDIGVAEIADDTAEKPSLYRLKDGYALVRDNTSDTLSKLGEGANAGYKKLEGAVRISLSNIADSTNQAVSKLRDGFNLQN